METRDLSERLAGLGKRMSKSHRRIAEFILASYDKAAFMTASHIGQTVGVSESTVVRFAMALGYEGYPELQKAVKEMIRARLTNVQRMEIMGEIGPREVLTSVLKTDMANIRGTIEQIDVPAFENAVSAISGARRIYVIGLRSSAPIAQFMAYYLGFIFGDVVLVQPGLSDVPEQIARMGAGDVLVGISFPRYSNRTIDAMIYARTCGAACIAITDGEASPLARCADHVLYARSEMSSFVDSLVAPLSLVNALIVALGVTRRKEVSDHFDKLEKIWENAHVYAAARKNTP